jgi:DNA polymerase III subunit delta'
MYERIATEQHDSLDGVPDPAENIAVFGHAALEAQFTAAYRAGKLPHALVFAGPRGIGKASMAFQLAHYLLSNPSPQTAPEQFAPRDPASSLYRQVASGAHPSLLHLTRPFNEKTKTFKTALTVDEIRRVGRFLSLTAHDGGYRLVIVDPADDMNTSAANALLKSLEEPPSRTLFVLIAHSVGRLLPTIRSRCQIVRFLPLADADLLAALAAVGKGPEPASRAAMLSRAAGSPRNAIILADYGGVEISDAVDRLLAAGDPDATEAHRLAEAVGGRDGSIPFAIFNTHVLDYLAAAASSAAERGDIERAGRTAELWHATRSTISEAETYNLDRKQHALGLIYRLGREIG